MKNTIPICVFSAKDSPGNLQTALEMYRPQVEDLMGKIGNGKTIKVFLFGDYEYQCNNYGLSGPSGTRLCIHCLCTKKNMEVPAGEKLDGDTTPRTLETLKSDHTAFMAAGSRLAQAKSYNNVIRPCLLPIPVQNAIVPALHLDLGIFVWLYGALEKDLRQLDLKLASQCAAVASDSTVFAKLAEPHRDLSAVKEQHAQAQQQCALFQHHMQYVALHMQEDYVEVMEELLRNLNDAYATADQERIQLDARQQELDQSIVKLGDSKDFHGPCEQSLDAMLQASGIERQVSSRMMGVSFK